MAAHALAALGAELNPVRQQVIRLLHGTQGTDELAGGRGARQRPPRWRHRGLLPEVLDRVESIDAQLSVIGQRMGAGPDTGDLDQQIALARRGKEAAAGEEDYENAAAFAGPPTATARRQDRPPAGVGGRTSRPCLPGRAAAPAGR